MTIPATSRNAPASCGRVTTVPPTGISPRPPLTVIVITSAPYIPRVMAMQDAPTLADAENLFLLRYHHNPPPSPCGILFSPKRLTSLFHLSIYMEYSFSLSQTNLNLKPNKLFFSTVCLNSSETNAYLVFSSKILNIETFSITVGKKTYFLNAIILFPSLYVL